MDKRLLVLALGMFALGTDTFVMAGVPPRIGQEFNIDVAIAGQLTTLYAIAYALLSPTIAALAASVPRKHLMLSGLGVFVLANLATALAPTFAIALISRVFAGLSAAMYAPLTLSRVLDKTSPTKLLLAMLTVLTLAMATIPWTSAQLWSSFLVVAVWGATGWGIQSTDPTWLPFIAARIRARDGLTTAVALQVPPR